MRRWRALLAMIAASAASFACADLLGFHDLREGQPDASDAAGPDVAQDVVTCTPARWPANPSQENKGDAGQFVIALHHVYMSSAPDGGVATFGYDLDGKCTTDNASASCTSANGIVDQPNGVDDQSITLMNTLIGAYPGVTDTLSDDHLNAAVATGYFTVLFRLFNYNGGSDQPLNKGLQVAIQASPGISGGTPKFDGTDRWTVSIDDSINSTSTYPKSLYNAYVAGGTLVASFPSAIAIHVNLPAGSISGPLAIVLTQPTVTAKLVPNGGGYDLVDGRIVGRWATHDILANVASLNINGSSLCSYLNGSVWPLITAKACTNTDIRAGGPDDDTAACDAVSVAIAFDGVAADVTGNPVPFPTSTTPCTTDAGECN